MMSKVIDIEELNKKADGLKSLQFAEPTEMCVVRYAPILHELAVKPQMTESEFKQLKRKYNFNGKNSFLLQIFAILKKRKLVDPGYEDVIRMRLRIKKGKSLSGVLVITVFTSPFPTYHDVGGNLHVQSFTCRNDCHYCPNQPNMPRSYLELEPGVLRASRNNFDTCEQIWDRLNALYRVGHPIDKLEVLVLGATFSHYPIEYQEEFCRDVYYAANTFVDPVPRRTKLSIEYEKKVNSISATKVIGLTLETRPDMITPEELVRFRKYGCTRVQLGLQHTDNEVLRKINRGCTNEDAIRAIKLLKDSCFKIDIHIMPNLYGSSIEKDTDMFLNQLLRLNSPIPKRHQVTCDELHEFWDLKCPELIVDQWKIYPTMIVPYTKIKELYEQGVYKPYSNEELENLLLHVLAIMYPFIRINRLVRDISGDYIIVGADSNMRQDLEKTLVHEGKHCMCIRSREVKDKAWDGSYMLVIREYEASQGREYFISAESHDTKTLYGFLRLRIPSSKINEVFEELSFCALLRELHVYGQLQETAGCSVGGVQHKGLGKVLIEKAKIIAKNNGYFKIAVIPGEGVREYYAARGFVDSMDKGKFMFCEFVDEIYSTSNVA